MSTTLLRLSLPTTPGAIIGYGKRGPIRIAAGGSGEGDPPPADPPKDPPPADPPDDAGQDDPEGTDKLGDAGKKALDAMKADRNAAKAKATAAEKEAADLRKRLATLEDRDKTEAEKLAAKAEAAEAKATQLRDRAVKAEIKALAAGSFADPSDAPAFLDLASYVDDDGEIDTEKMTADLAALLKNKPHLAKNTKAPGPRPDPSQGGRGEPATRPKSLTEAVSKEYARSTDGRT